MILNPSKKKLRFQIFPWVKIAEAPPKNYGKDVLFIRIKTLCKQWVASRLQLTGSGGGDCGPHFIRNFRNFPQFSKLLKKKPPSQLHLHSILQVGVLQINTEIKANFGGVFRPQFVDFKPKTEFKPLLKIAVSDIPMV